MPPETNSAPELRETLQSLEEKLDALLLALRVARLGPDSVFQFLYRDNLVKMHLPFADVDVIQRQIVLHHAFYEQKALQLAAKYIAPGAVVLDAGANIGNHTIFFAMICGAREVHSFEVMRETFKLLERNVRLNQLQNVRLHNLGLGSRAGRADLAHFGQGNIGGASIESAGTGGAYEIVTVDSLELPALDFLKIDVEGAHLDVLNGARETLARCRPRIWVELRVNRNEREGGVRLLTELGYRMIKELSRNDCLFEPG
jgi:FkbM family methyltransferase